MALRCRLFGWCLLLSLAGIRSENPPLGLPDILRLFDAGALIKGLEGSGVDISDQCALDVDNFLQSLVNRKLWALKAYDASGRYSTGFFWGNNYWVGSETLCYNIGTSRKHYSHSDETPAITRNSSKHDEDAPIPLGFFKSRLRYSPPIEISPHSHTILLGLCLPESCRETDVRMLLNISLEANLHTRESIAIEKIKTPHNKYLYWKDPIFWTLAGVFCTLYFLAVIGTIYDYILEKRAQNISNPPFINRGFAPSIDKLSCSIPRSIRHSPESTRDTAKLGDHSNSTDLMGSDRSSVTSEPELNLCTKFILAFSLRKNLQTICDASVGEDTIPTIHGLRFMSMSWVIIGHTCVIIFKYSDNLEFRTLIEKEFFFQTISNSPFSVDSFFFISGLLVSFLYFRTTAKIDVNSLTRSVGVKSNVIQFFGLIAYRFCRLTAPYMFILGCVQVSMKYFEYNSVFDPPTNDHSNCEMYWWRNALYINTLFPVQEMCMLWSWYLADDTQFYVLGLVILITAVTHLKAAAGMLITFLLSSWATTAYVAYSNNHMPSEDDPLTLFDKIYDKPWTRLGPYLIGMVVGWILFKKNCKIKFNKIVVAMGWLISIGGLFSLVYGLYDKKLDRITSSAYSSLSHSVWALCLAWIVIACSTGYGGIINSILSYNSLYPFSRVTYCAYLVHPLVIRSMIITMDSPFHLSTQFMIILYMGVVAMSYGISFVVSLLFEAPIVSLLRLLSPRRSKKHAG